MIPQESVLKGSKTLSIGVYFFQFTPKKNPIAFGYVVLLHLLIAARTRICTDNMFSTGYA